MNRKVVEVHGNHHHKLLGQKTYHVLSCLVSLLIKSDTFRPNCPYYFEYKGKDTYLPDKCLLDCTDDLTCIERCF